MFFSQVFNVSREDINKYGAIDISLVCDTPFFIDPMLIFNSSKLEYQALHTEIIRYFHFLYTKAKTGLSKNEISAWFNFSEVPNNWLGYSLSGNKGLALGIKYANFLHDNIDFALSTHNITRSVHVEKIMLLYEGSGKDKISDLIVNLIKDYLCRYTENFARKYIDPKYCKNLPVDKALFNYETESFFNNEYYLPYIINEKGEEEFVLLTPRDMVRSEEPAVNTVDLIRTHEVVRRAISNESLRAYVNNYIAKAVRQYEEEQKRKKKTPNAIIASVVAVIILIASLPSIIENTKNIEKEAYIESQIQEVVDSLERKIENQIDDDVTIAFSYNEFMGYEYSLEWSFKIRMAKFDEFVKAGGKDEKLLLEIMNNCRTIEKIVEAEDDSFDFNFEYDDVHIDISNYDGAVNYCNSSSSETFYYEEYDEKRYLHSRNTEYVLNK